LPDEYLHEVYIHKLGADFSACFQMHIVKYLKAHSDNYDLRGCMQNRMPYFTYQHPNNSNKYTACIEMDGEPYHKIGNLDVLYKELGYSLDIGKAGVLPDEFIWDEYTKGNPSPFASCLQMHIVAYLVKNSIAFIVEYGNQYQDWFDVHVAAVTEKNVSCVTCRMKSFCQIGMSSSKIPESLRGWLGSIIDNDK